MGRGRGKALFALLCSFCSCIAFQTFAARPEDAVFITGTLPLDDDGKEVSTSSLGSHECHMAFFSRI